MTCLWRRLSANWRESDVRRTQPQCLQSPSLSLTLRHDYRCRLVRRHGFFGSAVQQDNTDRSEKGASSDSGGVRGNRADGSEGRRMGAGGLSLRPGGSGGKSAEHAQSTARGAARTVRSPTTNGPTGFVRGHKVRSASREGSAHSPPRESRFISHIPATTPRPIPSSNRFQFNRVRYT